MVLRNKVFWLIFGLVCLFNGVATAAQPQKDVPLEVAPLTIGAAEIVVVEPEAERISLKARIDTGAETSSLGAVGIVPFERDGRPWVRFKIHNPANGEMVEMSRKVQKTILIKRHETKSQRRYVVEMWARIGSIKLKRLFSLTDRTDFEYPVLIGRNFLTGTAVVDVSRQYTQGKFGGGN